LELKENDIEKNIVKMSNTVKIEAKIHQTESIFQEEINDSE
jgi:hypothetical protein